jgi:hypothetical protein
MPQLFSGISLRKTLLFSANFFLVVFLFSACDKKTSLGGDLLDDESKNFRTIEYNQFFSHSLLESRVRTDEDSCNLNFLGSYNDPDFGILQSGFMLQYSLPFPNNLPISRLHPDSFSVDSVTVQLPYRLGSYYGNNETSLKYQRLQVFELKNNINKSDSYYSDLDFASYATTNSLADQFFVPDVTVITSSDLDTVPMLRVKLDKEFGNRLLSDTNSLKSSSAFLNFFKGLQFRVNNINQASLGGGIVGFDLNLRASKLTVYAKHQRLGTLKYSFTTNSDFAKVNFYTYKRSAQNSISQQLSDTTLGQNFIFVQGFGGTKAKVTLPFLNSFKDSLPVLLNKAELIFELQDENLSIFPPVSKLALRVHKSDGTVAKLSDENATGAFNINGILTSSNQYKFNITQYIYSLLYSDESDKGLFLSVDDGGLNPGRIKLKGGNNIRLKITYTKTN